jgi:hypothetical protein
VRIELTMRGKTKTIRTRRVIAQRMIEYEAAATKPARCLVQMG